MEYSSYFNGKFEFGTFRFKQLWRSSCPSYSWFVFFLFFPNLETFFPGLIFVVDKLLWSLGNHTSVASSTDTGDDHDTDIEDLLPLPPPRPRHWAKRAKEQSMMPDCNSSSTVKPENEHSKTDNASDWSRSIPQFPLPTFKSTMQSKLWTMFWILDYFTKHL